jgi:hypothetical protein
MMLPLHAKALAVTYLVVSKKAYLPPDSMNSNIRWLALEALVPLLGASVLYLIWGVFRYFARDPKAVGYTYHWKHAYDPMGWLYGGAVLAIQAGTKVLNHSNAGYLPHFCYIAAGSCLLLLMAAMSERGQSASWTPPRLLTWVSALLVAAILATSYRVQTTVISP